MSVDVLVTGSVPAGAGMSSSSALVCASALAIATAAGLHEIDKLAFVDMAIQSERLIGLNCGGMDQAASVCGERDSALHVGFVPTVTARPVAFPKINGSSLNLLVAQSLVASDKRVAAPEQYNLRVVECTLAALVLARITGVSKTVKPDTSPLGIALRTFGDEFFARKGRMTAGDDDDNDDDKQGIISQAKKLQELLQIVDNYLPQTEGYTRQQISEILGMSIEDLEARYMTKRPIRATHFKLRQRAQHVFGEALRVLRFLDLLEGTDAPMTAEESDALLKGLGDLMNETQTSCRDLYECSVPELDRLCDLARRAGSYGSRLSGAGWGGCSVHLVPDDKVEAVKKAWVDKYYRERNADIDPLKLQEVIVVSRPGSGSCIVHVKGDGRFCD